MCFVIILYVGLVFFILIFRFNIAICFFFLSSLLLFTTIDMVVTVCFHSERMLFANLWRVIAHLYANASQNIPLNEMFAVINVFHGKKSVFFSLSLSPGASFRLHRPRLNMTVCASDRRTGQMQR